MPTTRGSATTRRSRAVPSQSVRTYVLDTSVLLSDPRAMLRFAEHEVVLPVVVITELEGKRHHPELGYFAREALRLLDDLRVEHGGLADPVPVGDAGGSLRVELNHTDPASLPAGFRLGDNDTRILAVAKNLAGEGRDVTVVSKDLPMRVKASAVGLEAEEYRAELAVDSGWTGMTTLEVTDSQMSALYESGRREHEAAAELLVHTGLTVLGPSGSALGRVSPDRSVRLVRGDRDAFGLHGRSAEQRIALDLLLDPDVGIVSLGGRAGTGKSALALCAGLEAVMERDRLPPPLRRGRSGARLPAGHRERQDGPLGPGGVRHPGGRRLPGGRRGDPRPGHARGAAPDPHPRALAPRRLRHR